jgi:transposase
VKNNGISPASPTALPAPPRPDPEVVADAKRRTFTAQYKQRILAEADVAATQPGAIGALLRRECLYSSHLVTWRRERQAGIVRGLTP